ncbi:MAG: ribonuclease III [Pseudomonadota bacterium]|nr:ribonuclease III [Pseudomonadota bacterium]
MTGDIQDRIGHRFADQSLLEEALTHPSLIDRERARYPAANQRLEFLGDRVLGLVIARMLFETYKESAEGVLAKHFSAIVDKTTLAQLARALDLGAALRMTEGEETAGGRDKSSNLEDALEAVIAALYLDGGLSVAEAFIRAHWTDLVATPPIRHDADPKTALQEWAQRQGLDIPTYRETARSGPAHKPDFTVEACVEGLPPASATGSSKRTAEKAAAATLLERICHDEHA